MSLFIGSTRIASNNIVGDTVPIGAGMWYPSDTIPDNWLLCNGQAVSRTTYSELFAILGTTHGTGDGSTTFNLPNIKGRTIVGKDSADTDFNTIGKTLGSKFLQAHNHGTGESGYGFMISNSNVTVASGSQQYSNNAVRSTTASTGDGNSQNLQPSIVENYIIKAKQSIGVVATVVDTLTSTSTTNALSANQGYILNNQITNIYPVSLFTGATTDTTFALSSSVTNYKRIKIFYRDNNGIELSSREVYNNKANFSSDLFLYEVNGSAVEIRACRATFSGTSVSIANKYYNSTWGTSYIYITKILGFL